MTTIRDRLEKKIPEIFKSGGTWYSTANVWVSAPVNGYYAMVIYNGNLHPSSRIAVHIYPENYPEILFLELGWDLEEVAKKMLDVVRLHPSLGLFTNEFIKAQKD
jgi:hypothetical protein